MEKLKKIICKILENNEIEIKPELLLKSDLGFDSLQLVQLVGEIEEEYHMEISDEQFGKIRTVQDVWKYIKTTGE